MHSIKLAHLASGLDLISLLFWLFSLQRVIKKLFYHQFLFPTPCTEAAFYLSLLGAALKWSGRQACCIYLFNVSPSISVLSLSPSIFILHFQSFALFWFLVHKSLITSTVKITEILQTVFILILIRGVFLFCPYWIIISLTLSECIYGQISFYEGEESNMGYWPEKRLEILLIILEQTHCVLLNI